MNLKNKPAIIQATKLSIYDKINPNDTSRYYSQEELKETLESFLLGRCYPYPNRTRSKVVKQDICKALGYVTPTSFKKTQPRFLGQNFDVYVQKSNNLQIWNEPISPERRYVIIDLDEDSIVQHVKIILGSELKDLDHTNKLTAKYQAIVDKNKPQTNSRADTSTLAPFVTSNPISLNNPIASPQIGNIFDIKTIYQRLKPIIGTVFEYGNPNDERNRGWIIHDKTCRLLGYPISTDDGQYPDIPNQLLEVKLQTSPTIDIGCHKPDLFEEVTHLGNTIITNRDVRYLIYIADVFEQNGTRFAQIKNFHLVTGEDFYKHFNEMQGRGRNEKYQIPLPANFYNS